jgi:copper chaperone
MVTKVFSVPNISCQHCVHTIQRELRDVQGVHDVKADLDTKKVSVTYETDQDLPAILQTLDEIGYPAEGE